MPPDSHEAAKRLCAACGMCCDGVLFFGVRLSPEDSPRALAARGLKIKSRGHEPHLLQPCAAHQGNGCAIYSDRPTRCRVFECGQLLAVGNGASPESEARERIAEARRQVDRVKSLLRATGDLRENKALATRCDATFLEPLDPSPEARERRRELAEARAELENFLAVYFRVDPPAA